MAVGLRCWPCAVRPQPCAGSSAGRSRCPSQTQVPAFAHLRKAMQICRGRDAQATMRSNLRASNKPTTKTQGKGRHRTSLPVTTEHGCSRKKCPPTNQYMRSCRSCPSGDRRVHQCDVSTQLPQNHGSSGCPSGTSGGGGTSGDLACHMPGTAYSSECRLHFKRCSTAVHKGCRSQRGDSFTEGKGQGKDWPDCSGATRADSRHSIPACPCVR